MKRPTKKLILTAVVVGCLVALPFIIFEAYKVVQSEKNQPPSIEEIDAVCEQFPEIDCDNPTSELCHFSSCYPSLINTIYDHFAEHAIAEEDPSICSYVVGFDSGDYFTGKKNAIQSCKRGYAVEMQDVTICRTLSLRSRDLCLRDLANGLNDPVLCMEIKDKDMRESQCGVTSSE